MRLTFGFLILLVVFSYFAGGCGPTPSQNGIGITNSLAGRDIAIYANGVPAWTWHNGKPQNAVIGPGETQLVDPGHFDTYNYGYGYGFPTQVNVILEAKVYDRQTGEYLGRKESNPIYLWTTPVGSPGFYRCGFQASGVLWDVRDYVPVVKYEKR